MRGHLHTVLRFLSGPQAHHACSIPGSFFFLPSAGCTFSTFQFPSTTDPQSHRLVQSLSLADQKAVSSQLPFFV